MNKRLVLAMGIWFVLLMLWMGFYGTGSNDQQIPAQTNQQAETLPEAGADPVVTRPPAVQWDGAEYKGAITMLSMEEVLSNRTVLVETEQYAIGLSSVDAVVDAMRLQKYEDKGDKIDFIEKNLRHMGNFRVVLQGLENAERQPELIFNHEQKSDLQHVFTGSIPGGITLEKAYTFYPEQLYFDLKVSIKNPTATPWQNNRFKDTYALVWGSPVQWSDDDSRYEELSLLAYTLEGSIEKLSDKDTRFNAFYWMGLEDRYFLLAVMPVTADGQLRTDNKVNSADVATVKEGDSRNISFALNRSDQIVDARGELVDNYRIFFGPKKYSILTSDALKGYGLDSVFTGFFLTKWISIAFEQLLYMIYSVISNFGIAIIILTLVLKVILHPLTHKSFISMRKMQLLQPKLAALKEQYKSDPQTLQKRTMEMYKKEKVNPLGGCLPLLLQFPIFIALYQLLPRLVDLKNVSFLWIKDLSSPDVLFSIPALENVPILPSTFNPLPLIMTVVSIIQSRVQSKGHAAGSAETQQQQSQRKMMMFLPILFLFIFWNMPSGLVLYWTVQNIFSIVEQILINKKYTAISGSAQKA